MGPVQTKRGIVSKPVAVIGYNEGKSHIDISDQISNYNSSLRTCLFWYKKIALELIFGTSLVNSHIVYKLTKNNNMNITTFKEQIVKYLLVHVEPGAERPSSLKRIGQSLKLGTEPRNVTTPRGMTDSSAIRMGVTNRSTSSRVLADRRRTTTGLKPSAYTVRRHLLRTQKTARKAYEGPNYPWGEGGARKGNPPPNVKKIGRNMHLPSLIQPKKRGMGNLPLPFHKGGILSPTCWISPVLFDESDLSLTDASHDYQERRNSRVLSVAGSRRKQETADCEPLVGRDDVAPTGLSSLPARVPHVQHGQFSSGDILVRAVFRSQECSPGDGLRVLDTRRVAKLATALSNSIAKFANPSASMRDEAGSPEKGKNCWKGERDIPQNYSPFPIGSDLWTFEKSP
ncbi:hypothetical protein PR048_000312 [Dryococelus australis]|uniref:PiggyBac transposable element-derived protein domain-containing protein n=1 Tax=Dryococelus australis TaxID=614101 RepID=A0ABQ9IEA0_9NEOP|nr:hypothetical protein PR048_000312 [Dryococelus australis]